MAVSGDTVVVGARSEDSSTTGVNSAADEGASGAGAAYIFNGLGVATVTTPTSASIAATSATLGGNVTSDGGATITARGIVYAVTATNNNPQIGGTGVTTVAGSGTTGVFTVSASGLTANTAYTYAAYATTSAGTTYSSTGTFTTLPLPPAITNGTLTASGTFGSAITTYTITGSNTPTSYSATGLPAGLSLDPATGAITGTPTTTIGSPFSVTIGATNTGGTGTATLVLTVGQASQTITFGALANKAFGAASFTVAATASSSLTPSYSIVSGPATLSGSTVTLTGSGTVIVRASQAGNGNYTAATPVDQSFSVTTTVTQSNITYTYTVGVPTASVTGNTVTTITPIITIPSTITVGADTYEVTSIGASAFQNNSFLRRVTIGDKVTSIGANAFNFCRFLTNVTIRGNVTSIGASAFFTNTFWQSIRSIIFLGNAPSSVTGDPFASMVAPAYRLSSATGWGSTLGSLTMTEISGYGLEGDFNYVVAGGEATITDYAGAGGAVVTPTTLGGFPVKAVGYSAFGARDTANLNTSITSVTISSGVTNIGQWVFRGCTGMTSVTMPSGLTSIGSDAFRGCSSLDGVTIPETVTSLGYGAFQDCSSLASLSPLPSGITSLGGYTFIRTKITSITIPAGVTSLGVGDFIGCSFLTSITLPSGLTSIGNNAFESCTSLTSITIPSGVTSIGASAFSGCTVLANVTLPPRITSIAASTFLNCRGLTTLTIPSAVTSIGTTAFSGCTGLTAVYFQGDAPTGVAGMFTSVMAAGYRASAATGWTSPYFGLTMTAQSRPTVTTPTSASIATTTATLGGNVTAAGDTSLTDVGVVYAPTAINADPQLNGTSVTNLTGTTATGVMALSATGLTAGTGYSYAAYATNSVGTTYTTMAAITTGPVPTLTFATPTAATVAYGATLSNAATSTLSGAGYGAVSYTSSAPSIATIDAATGVVTAVALGTTTITATQGVAAGFNDTGSQTYVLTVSKATPTLTSNPSASSITYGQTLASSSLSGGSASVSGAFAFTTPSTAPNAGTTSQGVTFTPSDTTNYNAATTTVNVTVAKATPTISVAPTASGITYGQTLASSSLSGTASVAGAFAFTTSSTTPSAGAAAQGVSFTPTDATNYNSLTTTSSVTVAKATPTVTWVTPSAITYGTTLSATQLNAAASVAGAFTYSPASGSTPTAGTQTLSVGFVPTDTTNYNSVAATTVALEVGKATPTVTWATPSAITYGTTLSATQLNASGSVAGVIVYSPASGTTPSAGTQTLMATFTPMDAANYDTVSGTVALVVGKATPTVTWATPSAITYLTALSATQLNASSGGIGGTFAYSPASGSTLSAGTQTLSVGFVPTDTANYNSVDTTTVSLTVNKATPTITWATPSAITYGTALSATQLDASGSVSGTFVYSPASGTTPSAGTQTLTATFTPTDTTNYDTASGTISLVVGKATPTITWATPSAISYGTALSATQLNASSGGVAGAFTYSPASGTTPNAGTQTLGVGFVPTDTTNYNSFAATTVSLTVNKATPTIAWSTPSAITYGTSLSATQLSASSGGVAGAFTYSPASGAILSVGTQNLNATFTPTDTANYNPASASVALSVAVAAPGSPTAITATTANGEATVTFTAPSNPGSSAITGYTIRATATDGSIVTVNATGSPAKITGLTPGKSYRFTVTANNSAGSSESSTVTDALTISLVNQTITFASLADRVSNSGSFALSATASSGLPVTFNLVSGPGLLAGNVVDLTGATGTIKLRASQAGNATYAAAPAVEVSFAVTAGRTNVIFGQAFSSGSRVPAAELGLVLPGNGQPGSLLVVSNVIPGLNGVIALETTVSGGFIGTMVSSVAAAPLDARIQAAPVTYTITGTLLNGVLTGTIAPLGLVFTAPVPLPTGPSAAAAGLYVTSALVQAHGAVSVVVGANNDVLVLLQSATVTTGGLTTLQPDTTFALAAPGNGLITGTIDSVTTAATATFTLPGTAPVAFAGLNTATKRTDRLIGLASRAKVGTGESVLITGVAIGGTESKRVLIRAGGPALAGFGLNNTLTNPTLKIYRGSTLIAQNDDWNPADAAEMARLGIFAFPDGSKDAAILTTLEPGSYTAQVSDLSGTGTGVALAEIYDASVNPTADYQRLVSIASRGTVSLGDGALIGGFVVVGNAPKTLLIRGIGPTLTSFGLVGALADPVLTIYQDGEAIATNAGWANSAEIATAATQAGAFALVAGSRDAALLVTLKPGSYTAQVKAAQSASSGVALIEIYEVP